MKLKIPETIRSERTQLRRYREGDTESLFKLYSKNRERLIKSFPLTTKANSTLEGVKAFLIEETKKWETSDRFFYGVWTTDQTQIGQLQIKTINFDIPSCEIAYFVDEDHEGKGFTSEFVKAGLNVLFDDLKFRRVFVRVSPANAKSLKLIEGLGFRKEGLHRKEWINGHGVLCDMEYHSLLSDDRSKPGSSEAGAEFLARF